MRNLKLLLAYDGTSYLGWQKNGEIPTIERSLELALFQILRESVELQAASRTDAGVHALGQVVNFRTNHPISLRKLIGGLNGVLPDSIRVLTAEEMPDPFHPTLDNRGKIYLYQICCSAFQLPFYRTLSWHVPTRLDLKAMQEAIPHLLGSHDFSSFCNERSLWTRPTECNLEEILLIPQAHQRLHLLIKGDHFLYKMVRNLVGTLVAVGLHQLASDEIPLILEKKERAAAGVTAPAHGLSLKEVLF